MIRYERLTPVKAEVLGVEDWEMWQCPVGTTTLTLDVACAFYLEAGQIRLTPPNADPVLLEAGDWFALEAHATYALEILEAVDGYRHAES